MTPITALPRPLPEQLVELIAARFKVIGEPMRIRLLDQLREGPLGVQQLADVLGATQQNVSKHLGVLHSEGVVTRRRAGARVLYAISDDSVFEICETVCGGLRRQAAELDELLAGASR